MPVNASAIQLTLGGVALAPWHHQHLAEVGFEESLESMAKLTFTIRASDQIDIDALRLVVGQSVDFSIGWTPDLVPVFSGNISTLKPTFAADETTSIAVVCYDRGDRLRRTSPPMIYKGGSHKSIASDIAKRHNMQLVVKPPGKLTDFKLADDEAFMQEETTDWKLLSDIAGQHNYSLLVRGDTIYIVADEHLLKPEFHEAMRPGVTMTKPRYIYRPNPAEIVMPDIAPLASFEPSVDNDAERTRVEIKSWVAVGSDGLKYGRGKLTPDEQEKRNYTQIVVQVETIQTLRLTGVTARTSAQAKELVVANVKRRASQLVKGEAVLTHGDPRLRMGQVVTIELRDLQSFGTMFSGDYVVKAVSHGLDTEGVLVTSFDVRRDGVSTL